MSFNKEQYKNNGDKIIIKDYKDVCHHISLYDYAKNKDHFFCNNKETSIKLKNKEKTLKLNFLAKKYKSQKKDFLKYIINPNKDLKLLEDIVYNEDDVKSCLEVFETLDLYKYNFSLYGYMSKKDDNNKNDLKTFVISTSVDDSFVIKITIDNKTKIDNPFLMYKNENLNIFDQQIPELYILQCTVVLQYRYCECQECKNILPYKSSKYLASSRRTMISEVVFNDKDKIKLTKIYKKTFAMKTKEGEAKSYTRIYKDMLIYKKDTSMMYLVERFHVCGSLYLAKSEPRTIKNVTFNRAYSNEYVNNDSGMKLFTKLVNSHVKEIFPELYGFTFQDIENKLCYQKILNSNKMNLIRKIIFIKNKYNIKNTLLASYILSIRDVNKDILKDIKGLTEKEIYKLLSVKPKDISKLPKDKAIIGAHFYKYIKNKDYMNTINNTSYPAIYTSSIKSKHNFMYKYGRANSEKKIVNQLLKYQDSNRFYSYMLTDTITMYKSILTKIPEYKIDLKDKDIQEIHDILSSDLRKVKTKNKRIARDKILYPLVKDWKFKNITYRLAKDTHELIQVGSLMNICVGSYGTNAVKKKCYILIGYDENDNPVTCIELRKNENDNFKIYQVKKKHNKLSNYDEAYYISEKCVENGINWRTGDLTSILEQNELGGIV